LGAILPHYGGVHDTTANINKEATICNIYKSNLSRYITAIILILLLSPNNNKTPTISNTNNNNKATKATNNITTNKITSKSSNKYSLPVVSAGTTTRTVTNNFRLCLLGAILLYYGGVQDTTANINQEATIRNKGTPNSTNKMGTNNDTITLAADFDYDSIIFKWDKHLMNSLEYFSDRLDIKYGGIILTDDDLWDLLFDDPGTNHKELKSNALTLIREWYLDQVYKLAVDVITTNDKADIKTKMDIVPLMAFNTQNSTKVRVTSSAHLATLFTAYTTVKANDTEPEIFKDEYVCVLF